MRKASKRSVPLISFVEVNTNSKIIQYQLSASFKDMAASGGYWLACAGKEIYVRFLKTVVSKELPSLKPQVWTKQYPEIFHPHSPCFSRCSVVGSLGVIHMGLGVVSLMDKLGLESRVITFYG